MTDASVWEACTIIRSRRGLPPCKKCPGREPYGLAASEDWDWVGKPVCRSEAEAVVDQQREWD